MQFDQVMCSHDTDCMVKDVWYDIVRWGNDCLFYVHPARGDRVYALSVDDCVYLDNRPGAFYSFRKKHRPVRDVVYIRVVRGSWGEIYGPFENMGKVLEAGYVWEVADKVIFAHVPEDTPFEDVVEILFEKEKS